MARRKLPESASEQALAFIDLLTHTGDFNGVPFKLRLWQRDVVRRLFEARPDGLRRYRKLFLALPRKQGKTELSAAILLYLMFGTGKRDQQIYSASGDRDQAALIYRSAASMVRNDPRLSAVCHLYDGYKRIICEPLNSVYQALSSDAPRKHGLRPSAVLIDELHVLPNRDLFKALMTAFGATIEPLTVMITTAGWDRTSLCWEQWQYAEAVRSGQIDDPTFLPIIYQAPEGADWTDEAVWRDAMPALGDFCQLDFIREECKQAQLLPGYENTFRQLYLNQWTEQAERWLSVTAWNACVGNFTPADLVGQSCYAGLDMGLTGDMACYFMIFPQPDGTVRVLGHGWVPRDGKWRDELRNKDRYQAWQRQGYLTFTEGLAPYEVVDRNRIKADILRWHAKYPVYSLFADRAYATDLLLDLYNEEMLPVKGIPQGPVTLNEACVSLEEMVLGRQIEHGANPILDWNVQNASVKRGTTGLMCLDKSSATERIDGLAALINALAAYKADPEQRGPSVYDQPGNLGL